MCQNWKIQKVRTQIERKEERHEERQEKNEATKQNMPACTQQQQNGKHVKVM